MKNNLNNQKGVTIISLVITIIVLLILASVSLDALMGPNGLVNEATETKDMQLNEMAYQDEKLNKLYSNFDELMDEKKDIL